MEYLFLLICLVLAIVFACKRNWGAVTGWLFAFLAQAQIVISLLDKY